MSFIFGGDTGQSYEDIQRKRRIAEKLLMNSKAPRNVGEGLSAIGDALAYRGMQRRADAAEKRMREYESAMEGREMGSDSRRDVIEALLKGVPGYARGTAFHPGGLAVVGERGPEVLNLPRGAQVIPGQGNMFVPGQDPDDMMPPDPDEYLREELGDELFQQYRNMTPEQRKQFMEDPNNGFAPPVDTTRKVFEAQSRFDDANAYRVADLDAHKLMSLKPEYEDAVEADINTSEGQRIALLRRMMFADLALEDPSLAEAMTRWDNAIAGKMGALGRLYTGDDFELGRLMAEQFANAVLRNDSGAQAPESEVQRYARQFFPLVNEGDSELRAKKAMRRETIRALEQALGGDAAPAVKQLKQEIEMLRKMADVPTGDEISDEDKDFLKSLGLE